MNELVSITLVLIMHKYHIVVAMSQVEVIHQLTNVL